MSASRSGRELWKLLPEVYRNRDGAGDPGRPQPARGDLELYLEACGTLLDRVRRLLDQRYADNFPAAPPGEPAAQAWLLPYFAELFDVRLRSPATAGQRQEVGRAVAWRRSKGTLRTLEQIAEAVGLFEVVIQEGWQRVALTARVDVPLLPAAAFGVPEPDRRRPQEAASQPGLALGTIDVRRSSRAVQPAGPHPQAMTSRFPGQSAEVRWIRRNPRGAPCFPGSYEDASVCTVDLRNPSLRQGHCNPNRLLLYLQPPLGYLGVVGLPAQDRYDLRDQAFETVQAATADAEVPVIRAENCLFDSIDAPNGLVRLEACTVMREIRCRRLLASDCLFAGRLTITDRQDDPPSCVRYSRLPSGRLALPRDQRPFCTSARPIFFEVGSCGPGGLGTRPGIGDPGYGTLHPAAPEAIRLGAEDGGEMGAFHRRSRTLARAALLEKLQEFLPVGLEVVLIDDPRLWVVPPTIS